MSCNRAGSIPTAQSLRRQDTLESWRTPVVKPQERVDEPSPKPPAVVMNSGVQPMVFNHCQVTIVQAAAEDEKEEEKSRKHARSLSTECTGDHTGARKQYTYFENVGPLQTCPLEPTDRHGRRYVNGSQR